MNHFYWDASALVKRYAPEIGTPLVNHLFADVVLDSNDVPGHWHW